MFFGRRTLLFLVLLLGLVWLRRFVVVVGGQERLL
jgi:hypothetical protein